MSYYYGYARVSAKDQNLARQIKALLEFGVSENKIFSDKISGKNFDRPEYIKLVKKAKRNDVIVIQSIDRLGRNYDEILYQWRYLVKRRGIDIVVLDMPLLDTRDQKIGGLTREFIADLVLQILAYVAETERRKIKVRQAEGIAIAKEQGVKFGRPHKEIPAYFKECKNKYLNGELSSRQAASLCEITQTTFLRWVKTL